MNKIDEDYNDYEEQKPKGFNVLAAENELNENLDTKANNEHNPTADCIV